MAMRFALVGLGHHGRNAVAPAFHHPEARVRLRTACDARREALDAFRGEVERRTTDYREMLRDGSVDAVYVAAGMDRHCGIVLDCLEAGKHVLVEKPMAADGGECRRMIGKAREKGLLLAVNFESRYGEQNAILRRWLAGGHLGRVEALHFSNLWDGHKRDGPVKERRARLMALAGALDCGIHKLDQARFLAGGSWKRVEAVGAWLGEEQFVPPPHIGILGQLDNGVAVTVVSSLTWASTIAARPFVNTLEIAGTRGVALCRSTPDFQRMNLQLHSRTLTEERDIDATGHTEDIVQVLNDFEAVVREGPAASDRLARGEDGLQAQIAMEKAHESAVRARIPVAGEA